MLWSFQVVYKSRHAAIAFACLTLALYPEISFAEVSDKEPGVSLFWSVGSATALVCLVSARIKPWLGLLSFLPAALWFISLFWEIHAPDLAVNLQLEQGTSYYLHAYAAFGMVLCGLALGYAWHRRTLS